MSVAQRSESRRIHSSRMLVSRGVQANTYDLHTRQSVAELTYEQSSPPVASQMMEANRSLVSSLLLYHSRTGFEFSEPAADYAELRCVVCSCFLLNCENERCEMFVNIQVEQK